VASCGRKIRNWRIEFDAQITSTKVKHEAKVYRCNKQKRQPNNTGVTSPKNIEIDDDYKFIDYSVTDAEGIPTKRSRGFLGLDEDGNAYFLTKEDSKLLYSADEIYGDATFSQTSGSTSGNLTAILKPKISHS